MPVPPIAYGVYVLIWTMSKNELAYIVMAYIIMAYILMALV